jgi:hypothetical protein
MQNIVSISDGGHIAGLYGLDARILRTDGILRTLDRSYGNGMFYDAARAAGISPSGDFVAGWIEFGGVNVVSCAAVWAWNNSSYSRNLISIPGILDNTFPTAKALAVSSSGQVVGWYLKSMNGTTVKRGFRTQAGAATQYIIQLSDVLNPLIDNTVNLSTAYAVNASGAAVGVTYNAFSTALPSYWAATASTPILIGELLDLTFPVNPSSATYLPHGEILSLNGTGQMVGRSWSSSNQVYRAMIATEAKTKAARDLNDPHFVRLPAGAVLEDAIAINESKHILCIARVNGVARAFLLVPRVPGN